MSILAGWSALVTSACVAWQVDKRRRRAFGLPGGMSDLRWALDELARDLEGEQ